MILQARILYSDLLLLWKSGVLPLKMHSYYGYPNVASFNKVACLWSSKAIHFCLNIVSNA